ncbi:hypothetical protein [Streptomyces sp. NPDC059378]|uniref:hypothetical protein n=1 Tax=Streptomyces sp. NPDC059378 TaxID=3346815 RepID=UPI00369FA5A5
MRGHSRRALSKIFLLVALLGLTVPTATASASARVIHQRTVELALTGTLSTTPEPVDISGRIRITVVTVANAGGGGTATITSQLRNTTGIGRSTGGHYRFVGSDRSIVAWPPDPVSPLNVFPRFLKISPPGSFVPPNPIRPVHVHTTVLSDGSIDSISADLPESGPDA